MFDVKTALKTIGIMLLLLLAFLLFHFRFIRAILATVIFVAIAIIGIVWTFLVLGNNNHGLIKRIVKFWLRTLLMSGYIYGLLLIIPMLWKAL